MAGRRAQRKTKAATGRSSRLARHTMFGLLTLAVVAALVWGLHRLGAEAQREIASRSRYTVHVSDIDCNTPPGVDRTTFLNEVRYLSNLPETFQSIDPDQSSRLKAAFAAHPWVAAVERVTIEPQGTPRVNLSFRVPFLVIRVEGGNSRVVDCEGVLLPTGTVASDLPELITPVPARSISAGRSWPDEMVQRAVELVRTHHPRTVQKSEPGWRLILGDGRTVLVER